MEVHHHSHLASGETHTARKKWTHYFWEFLMLFFAVTMGFFVENQREHYIEHQREKIYAAQLYKDLKFDTLIFSDIARKKTKQLGLYDSVSLLFKNNVSFTDDEFVRVARNLIDAYNPANISTTFNQMKNSGSLRYIKNADLSSILSDYYDSRIPRLLKFFDYINEKLHTQVEPFLTQHFDLSVTEFYFDFNSPGNMSLPPNLRYYDRTENSDLLIKNYYKLYYNGVSFICHSPLEDANKRAANLINELKKEYHLK